MSLDNYAQAKWIVPHVTTRTQVSSWCRKVDRDLTAAQLKDLDLDNRLKIAYDAARQLAEMALAASGYRPGKGQGSHYYAIQSLRYTLSLSRDDVLLLDLYRKRRNQSVYDDPLSASERDVQELVTFTFELRTTLMGWLRANHPSLLPDDK